MKIKNEDMVFVVKTWGFERWIWNSDKYCGKLLHIDEGHFTSWHYHKLKDEVMYVSSGVLKIIYGSTDEMDDCDTKIAILIPGDAFHIPVGLRHRLIAVNGPVDLFEFSTQHFDEDSIRVEPGS